MSGNSFFGSSAGQANVTGPQNAFFGFESGMNNTSGSNSFFGSGSGRVNTTGGLNAFFGTQAGTANTIGSRNAFFGSGAGFRTTIGSDNTFFGLAAGDPNTEGNRNTIIGSLAGASNTTENGNTFIGYTANGTAGITNATAIGASSLVSQSDSLVLGNNVKVGIGTSAPDFKLEVADKANTGLRVVTGSPGGTVASFGGNGVFQVDAPFIPAGRLKISESGKVFVPQPSSLVLRAPDNGCWAVSVSNTGALSAVSVACP